MTAGFFIISFALLDLGRQRAVRQRLRQTERRPARDGNFKFCIFMATMPFLMALDIAKTSSTCDELMEVLIIKRMEGGVACEEKIT